MGKTCSKIPHASPKAAENALHSLVRSGKPVGLLQVYLCKACSAWHVGNAKGGNEAKRRRLLSRIDRALNEDARKRKTTT